jgi:hypothetical protein
MLQLLKGPGARCALEVHRDDNQVVLAMLEEDCHLGLKQHPVKWTERYGDGDNVRYLSVHFDDRWKPVMRPGPSGLEPYSAYEAARKMIRGIFGPPLGYRGGVLSALMEVLPEGDVHLFTANEGLIGRFCSVDDARMIAAAIGETNPIVFESPQEFMALAPASKDVVLRQIDPKREWPVQFNSKLANEVFQMVTKVPKKKTTKTAATAKPEKKGRADGPVAKAREIFAKMKGEASIDIIAACVKAGVNKGTATTQLGRWRKENGIEVKRGGSRTKSEGKATAAQKPAKKKAAKTKSVSGDTIKQDVRVADIKAKKAAKKKKKAEAKTKHVLGGEQPEHLAGSSIALSEEGDGDSGVLTSSDAETHPDVAQSSAITQEVSA